MTHTMQQPLQLLLLLLPLLLQLLRLRPQLTRLEPVEHAAPSQCLQAVRQAPHARHAGWMPLAQQLGVEVQEVLAQGARVVVVPGRHGAAHQVSEGGEGVWVGLAQHLAPQLERLLLRGAKALLVLAAREEEGCCWDLQKSKNQQ